MKWPKQLPELSKEQVLAREGWMKYWHEVLPAKYGIIEKFNHGYPAALVAKANPGAESRIKTLEVGAGLGEHLGWENLTNQDYEMLEYRESWVELLRRKFPLQKSYHADIQTKTNFESDSFDRIVIIHVLEHLPDLPAALLEMKRLIKPEGEIHAVIPCEGGLAYSLARKISAERLFKKKFKMDYHPIIAAEHINTAKEIFEELKKADFIISDSVYFPLKIPMIDPNLCVGLTLRKKFKSKF